MTSQLKIVANQVRESNLDWVMVRPPKLKHMPGRDNYRIGHALNINLPAGLAHADVADFMVKSTTVATHLGQVIEIGY